MKKTGFTLAEVLIVLVILGLIAAMTITTLLNNANQRIFLTGLQKAYSTLTNSFELAAITPGATPSGANGNNTNTYIVNNILVPTLKIAKKGDNWVQTQDGMVFMVNVDSASSCTTNDTCGFLIVDINGPKGPNTGTSIVENTDTLKISDQFIFALYAQGIRIDDNTATARALINTANNEQLNAIRKQRRDGLSSGKTIKYNNGEPTLK